jgi:molybdate transport system substrate-binding protein
VQRRLSTVAGVAACVLALTASAAAEQLRAMTSGGFTSAYLELVPEFERTTGHTVATSFGASMGDAPDSIPARLRRGEPVDVLILARQALDDLVAERRVAADSRVDLVRSGIGMAVRAGAPKPDIRSVEALRRTLLDARSVAYSASASGLYLSTELFDRLGIAGAMKGKARRIESERVGAVVARGEAEIGFQQISELLPVAGIEYVGPLPPEVQRLTVFAAGVATNAAAPRAARALIAFLAAPAARPVMLRHGLEPIH